ncbi:acetolactate synthase, small subunit [Desulfobulbus propionicus DSM 2032]|uniref:acetolactate synthase n=1 Tax=Desulfobulbus propionicus (strain ATCC 33891 / DSM 2032 / VKM B-1956 / 1pr3) TaxID=577650 RepID=A0A7U3YJM8_DESPD|nr:ACT domain-containing protein [Desulfobulbus propionicus]ADW16623.1 acetolactate synthase, small subunit [Desulfobulbus propionicus DSM 2032]
MNTAILRLTVNNHPGVMLQICGLFARRAFNLEGIFCNAIDQGATSCIWLTVDETDKLEQVIKQLAKLEDVLAIEERDDARARIQEMEALMARIA